MFTCESSITFINSIAPFSLMLFAYLIKQEYLPNI